MTLAKGRVDTFSPFLERMVTCHPLEWNYLATEEPINPVPPAITTRLPTFSMFLIGVKFPLYSKNLRPPKMEGTDILPSKFQPLGVCSSNHSLLGKKIDGIGRR